MGPRGIGPGALWVDPRSPYFFQFRVPLIGVKRWFEALNGKIYHLLSHIFRTESVKYNFVPSTSLAARSNKIRLHCVLS